MDNIWNVELFRNLSIINRYSREGEDMCPMFTITEYNVMLNFWQYNGFNTNIQQSDLILIKELMLVQLPQSGMVADIVNKIVEWELNMGIENMLTTDLDKVDYETEIVLEILKEG